MGQQLRKARKTRKLSLRALAAAAGCSFTHISDLEQGRKNASDETINGLARALGISPAPLLRANNLARAARIRERAEQEIAELS